MLHQVHADLAQLIGRVAAPLAVLLAAGGARIVGADAQGGQAGDVHLIAQAACVEVRVAQGAGVETAVQERLAGGADLQGLPLVGGGEQAGQIVYPSAVLPDLVRPGLLQGVALGERFQALQHQGRAVAGAVGGHAVEPVHQLPVGSRPACALALRLLRWGQLHATGGNQEHAGLQRRFIGVGGADVQAQGVGLVNGQGGHGGGGLST